MLKKVGNDMGYLDVKELTEGSKVRTKAYLIGSRAGTSVTGQGFFTFYLKDVNNNIVTARLFDVKDFTEKGFVLSQMKRKPIMVEFTVSSFNGSKSLIIHEISVWEGEFDYSKFLGKLERAEDILERVNKTLMPYYGQDKNAFRSSLLNESYQNVCNGLVGGYTKLLEIVVRDVMGYLDTPGVNPVLLIATLVKTMNVYPKYLELKEKLDVVMEHELLNIIYSSVHNISDERLKNICVDCLTSVMGINAPRHLYAHIVFDSVRKAEKNLHYSYEYPMVLDLSSKRIGDDLLAKY